MRGIRSGLIAALAVAAVGANAQIFSATQDTDAVLGSGLDNSNFGGSTWVSENYAGATSVIAYIQFDVSTLSPGSVASAKLRMFHDFNTTPGVSYDIHRVLGSWAENTLTGANAPGYDATPSASLVFDGAAAVWREWDVTSLVQGWVNGANTNFGMVIFRNPNQGPWPYLRSRNHGTVDTRPQLVVQAVPEPATMIALAGGVAVLLRRRRKSA
jgi:hypothetical protein